LKLLLDEHLSPAIAEQLKARGHDVVTVAEAGLTGFDDAQVLASATSDRRAVVTNNVRDFRPLHAAYLTMNTTHYGIVLVPRGRYSLAREKLGPLVTALNMLLIQYSGDDALRGREYSL
jgi:hypothetical protein